MSYSSPFVHSHMASPSLQSFAHPISITAAREDFIISMRWSVIDFEYSRSEENHDSKLLTASFIDHRQNIEVYDISQYNSEIYHDYCYKSFLHAIKNKLKSYDMIFGWGSRVIRRRLDFAAVCGKSILGFDSDFAVLDQNLRHEGMASIVGFTEKYSFLSPPQNDIDLIRLFGKPFVRQGIFDNAYSSLSLDCVARALLGRTKSGCGAEVSLMNAQKRIEYCKNDTLLIHDLLHKLNDYGVFQILSELSQRTGLKIDQLANNRFTVLW